MDDDISNGVANKDLEAATQEIDLLSGDDVVGTATATVTATAADTAVATNQETPNGSTNQVAVPGNNNTLVNQPPTSTSTTALPPPPPPPPSTSSTTTPLFTSSPAIAKIAAIVDSVRKQKEEVSINSGGSSGNVIIPVVDIASIARGEVDKFYDYNEEEEHDYDYDNDDVDNAAAAGGGEYGNGDGQETGFDEETGNTTAGNNPTAAESTTPAAANNSNTASNNNTASNGTTLADRATSIISSYSEYLKDVVEGVASNVNNNELYIVGHHENDHDTFDGDFMERDDGITIPNSNSISSSSSEEKNKRNNVEDIRSYGQNILKLAEDAVSHNHHHHGAPIPPPPPPGSEGVVGEIPKSPPPIGIWNNHKITNIDGDVITKGGGLHRKRKGILKNAKNVKNKIVQRLSAGGAASGGMRGGGGGASSNNDGDIRNNNHMMMEEEFNEICQELGVNPGTHPHLSQQQKKRNHRTNYKYPMCHSQKCKTIMIYASIASMLLIIIAVTVSEVYKGMEHVHDRNSKFNPDWNEFDEKLQKMHENDADDEWDVEFDEDKPPAVGGDGSSSSGSVSVSGSGSVSGGGTNKEEAILDYSMEEEYFPIWFDRTSGWNGQTWVEALMFCESKDEFIPCPYQVYCPGGIEGGLIEGGTMEEGDSWSPVGDRGPNEWVQVGTEGTCVQYSIMHNELPAWSTSGMGNEEITRHIMCCRAQPLLGGCGDGGGGADDSDSDSSTNVDNASSSSMTDHEFVANAVHDTFHPSWFSDEDGWEGTTYRNAIAFCESIPHGNDGHTLHLCPLQAICPNGPNSKIESSLSMDSFDGEQWAPFVGSTSLGVNNLWVLVGNAIKTIDDETLTCNTYDSLLGTQPSWGLDGSSSEIKKHILCCEQAAADDAGGSSLSETDTATQDSGAGLSATDASIQDPEFDLVYQSLLDDYLPVKYDRSNGWIGQTYSAAIEFCASHDNNIPCPYRVFCPSGGGQLPDGAWQSGDSWAAIIDSENDWVQVGTDGECNRYSTVYGKTPEWGIKGVANEDITRHIMCCRGVHDEGEVSLADLTTSEETDASPSNAVDVFSQPMSVLEEEVVQKFHPMWYDKNDGWSGATYDDATVFCESKSRQLCPLAAYCPNGPSYQGNPLFLNKEAFEGEQWAPFSGVGGNHWVLVGDLFVGDGKSEVCKPFFELFHATPGWGEDGSNSDSKQHILCCDSDSSTTVNTNAQELSYSDIYQSVWQDYFPVTFDRSTGWTGQTYSEAAEFCDSHDNYIICPYSAFCPAGHNKLLEGTLDDGNSWAPIIDMANDWVQVGPNGECERYSDMIGDGGTPAWGFSGSEGNEEMTRHIMCCRATSAMQIGDTSIDSAVDDVSLPADPKSEAIREEFDPSWFSTAEGWGGTTYDDAEAFCESNTKQLCPFQAYCPNNPIQGNPLFFQKEAFEGEQWAPTSNANNSWVMVGKVNKDMPLTCRTHFDLNHKLPDWGVDGSRTEIKKNILCCKKNTSASGSANASVDDNVSDLHPNFGMPQPDNSAVISAEGHIGAGNSSPHTGIAGSVTEGLEKSLHPVWFDSSSGWNGSSHADAVALCEAKRGTTGKPMILCPYAVYCPDGPSNPVIANHDGIDFLVEGEQWAPAYGQGGNHWIMIGMNGSNKITQCLSYSDIHNEEPIWGLDDSRHEIKKHMMCCSVPG